MNVAVKFTIDGSDVDFYEQEILWTPCKHDQDYELQKSQTNFPLLFLKGEAWETVTLSIREIYSTTKAKIDQLIDAKSEMKLYYNYFYEPTDYINVIYFPNKMKVYNYTIGELQADIIHKLIFLKSS